MAWVIGNAQKTPIETSPKFSTRWEGMGVLVEEARNEGEQIHPSIIEGPFPYAVALAFLKAEPSVSYQKRN
ncbi:hypothetical protein [Brevibacillus choshinensis]|uniref:hypothetical protein n=1 Tax=Brevibacillus choshinensis TaxID=54911 RepID=UPI002E2427BE|nr:hypothetical protein [Brevibacillus choshinensis]